MSRSPRRDADRPPKIFRNDEPLFSPEQTKMHEAALVPRAPSYEGVLGRCEAVDALQPLLPKLRAKIDPAGAGETMAAAQTLKSARENWNHQRLRATVAKIMVGELERLVVDDELDSLSAADDPQQRTRPARETKAIEQLRSSLSAADLADFLPLGHAGGDEATTVLGLTQDDLRVRPVPSECAAVVRELLEARLLRRCGGLLGVVDPAGGDAGADADARRKTRDFAADAGPATAKRTYERICRLPEMIRTEVENVEAHELQQQSLPLHGGCGGDALRLAERERLSLLAANAACLQALATRRTIGGSDADATANKVSFVQAKCKTIALKIRKLELDILCHTYTPESVAALNKIDRRLRSEVKETNEEIQRLRSQLQQYESAGASFDAVVTEFGALQADIDGKRWALRELKNK